MMGLIRGRIDVAGLFGLVLVSACAVPPRAAAQEPEGGYRFNIDSVTGTQFRDYLRKFQFATDSEAGDRQVLMLGHYPDSARLGPLAMIVPELHGYDATSEEFEQGRVFARIVNESADSYPRLGLLPHAVTYVWAKYDPKTESRSAWLITLSADSVIIGRTAVDFEITAHYQTFRPNQPLARFVWTEFGEMPWWPCVGKCCKTTLSLRK